MWTEILMGLCLALAIMCGVSIATKTFIICLCEGSMEDTPAAHVVVLGLATACFVWLAGWLGG